MNGWDLFTLVAYFAIVIGAGVWFRRRAARSLEAYFLAGKSLHWSLLSMSGAVSNFDITGTMWMVSVLFILGMQSWWHHWMWGVALPAFTLAFMARWVRRSKVLTAAEWMKTRFGDDAGGRLARYATALMAVIYTVALLGYAFQGISKFAVVFLPPEYDETVFALAIFAVTTLYVLLGGLYSVVVTDVIQTIILTAAGILIAAIAYFNITPEVIQEQVPDGFSRLAPSWRLEHLAGTKHAAYEFFGLLTLVWIAKGLLMNAGGPAQQYDFQRYLAAASVRDACKIAAAWPLFLVVRWGMVMGITLLAMTGALTVTDPEQIMPAILQQYLPVGIRGIVLAGLLAAFMSTFSSTVNAGASFLVRDLWQAIFRPHAPERNLIRSSYLATVVLVLCGVLAGLCATSIAQIWNWAMMALTAGVIVPNVLRWYWWRLNGWGYAAGVFGGIVLSVIALFVPDIPIYQIFPTICLGSLAASIMVALLTAPTERGVLAAFYRTVRPFGFWDAVRQDVRADHDVAVSPGESAPRAVLNTLLGILGLTALYLGPMYLVGHWHVEAAVCAAVFLLAAVSLYFTWYRCTA